MTTTQKTKGLATQFKFMFILSLSCFYLSLFRSYYTGSIMFLFLNWNLFLAFIPWALSSIVLLKPRWQKNRLILFLLLLVWFLFFPNAPYILTDLYHLKHKLAMPIWFDLLLILSFAFTGLLFGFISLKNIEQLFKDKLNRKWVLTISTVLLFIISFGIYLGRYLRWNSWDLVSKPFLVFSDVSERIFNPFDHPDTWGMTLLMGVFLNMIYWANYYLNYHK